MLRWFGDNCKGLIIKKLLVITIFGTCGDQREMGRVLIHGIREEIHRNECVIIIGFNIWYMCVCVFSCWLFRMKYLCNACLWNKGWMWNNFMVIFLCNEPIWFTYDFKYGYLIMIMIMIMIMHVVCDCWLTWVMVSSTSKAIVVKYKT